MNEEAALQARIAALAGQINKHKQQPLAQPPHLGGTRPANRWSPYGRGGARVGFPAAHKNRTLVLGGAQNPNTASNTAVSKHEPKDQQQYISSRGAGVSQILSKDTYAREQKHRAEFQGQPRAIKPNQEVALIPSATAAPTRPSSRQAHILIIDGLQFQVQNDGSKLIRLPDQSPETPKRCKVADVEFLRTKHGNLLRAGDRKGAPRPVPKPKPRCENFTKYGTCPFGPGCRFAHIPTEVAICKDFLRKGSCPAGQDCNLSHEPTYHRVPACTHFLRGNCTNSACRYPHVNVSSASPVCRPFATLGFCPRGPDCERRHVFECPDYANHGHCANLEKKECQLPHIDHAATLRKIARRQAKIGAEDESDVSSNDEEVQDEQIPNDIDSDEVEEDVLMETDHSHALSQQSDFVPLV